MKQVCVPLHLQDSLDNKEKRRVAKIPSNPIFLVEPAEVPVYPTILVDTIDKRTETQVPINAIMHMVSLLRVLFNVDLQVSYSRG